MMSNNYIRSFLVIFIIVLVAWGTNITRSSKLKVTKSLSSNEEIDTQMDNSFFKIKTPGKELDTNLELSSEEMSDSAEETDDNNASKSMEKVSKSDAKKKKNKDKIDLEKMVSIIDERFDDELEKIMLKEGLKTYEANSYLPSNLTPFGNRGSDPLERLGSETRQVSLKPVANPSGNNHNPPNDEDQIDLAIYAVSSKDKSAYVANEDPIELYFEAYNKDMRIPAQVKANIYNEDKKLVTTLAYKEISPLKYATTFENPYQFSNTPEGKYFVKIQATTKTNKSVAQKINMVESFSINSKKTRFGGSVSDTLNASGNLQINVPYRVYVSGTYLIQASLYDNADKIIAFYEEPMHLERASQVIIPLEFHGYFFYQRKLNGPFNLKNISLSYVNSNLTNEVGGVNSPNHITKNYQWTEFNPSPYENAEVRDKIKSIDNYLNSILAAN